MEPSRITIRPFKLSDVDDFMIWANDDKLLQSSKKTAFACIEDGLKHLRDVAIPHPWRRSICVDDHSVGVVVVYPGSNEFICRGEIGYALSSPYWGQGIATIAVKLALSSVFKDFPEMKRLQALTDADNKASQRVLEKAGFMKEGTMRKYIVIKGKINDTVIYSFLSTDSIPTF